MSLDTWVAPNVKKTLYKIWLSKSWDKYNINYIGYFGANLNQLDFNWLVSLFNGISAFVGYLMPKPFS